MKPPFKDDVAQPLPGLQLTEICPRAGVINPIAYNALTADKSLVGKNIAPGDDIYILSTADVEGGDLAAIMTPDGLLVRFVHWYAEPTGLLRIRLEGANPEIATRVYDYDDQSVRTRWRVVWICRHGDHSRCSPFKQDAREIC